MKTTLSNLLILWVTLCLSGCATPLQVQLTANKRLNPDSNGHPLPVQVVIYQLRDTDEFAAATFTELWQNDRAVLDGSLLSRREINIAPGMKKNISLNRNKETAAIGVIAIFRNPQAGHWRASKAIGKSMPLLKKQIHIALKNNSVSVP